MMSTGNCKSMKISIAKMDLIKIALKWKTMNCSLVSVIHLMKNA